MNYIFFDTNVILKIYEVEKLFKIFIDITNNNNNNIYITSVTCDEFNIITKTRNLFEQDKCDSLFEKLKIHDCKRIFKSKKDEILYRDFINNPPHRTKMGRKDYQDNHRDTLNWFTIIDFANRIFDSKSSFTFYTNDNDFLKFQNFLTDEFHKKTTKNIEIKNFYPFEIFKNTFIEPNNTFCTIDFPDLKEWFFTFYEIIDKYDEGITKNKKEVLKIVKLFLDPKIYKKHPISYLLNEYKNNKPKDIQSYGDRYCILFYQKITNQTFLKKFKHNGRNIFDKNYIKNIENNFKYLH